MARPYDAAGLSAGGHRLALTALPAWLGRGGRHSAITANIWIPVTIVSTAPENRSDRNSMELGRPTQHRGDLCQLLLGHTASYTPISWRKIDPEPVGIVL
jgi:hypothetical protein